MSPSPSPLRDPRAVALLLAATLTTMANAAISPALPGLEAQFSDHPHAALLTRCLVPAPSVAVVLAAGWVGRMTDRLGRRKLLLSGVGLFAAAGCAGMAQSSLEALLLSRLALGLAVALIMTAQTALIADFFSGEARSRVLGLQISARNIGGFVSITLAGVLALISPMHAFAIHGLALLILPVLWIAIREPAPARQPAGLSAAKEASTRLQPRIWAVAALQMATTACFFTMPTQLPFFIDALGQPNTALIGAVMGALTLSGAVAASRYGPLRTKFGHSRLFAIGYGLMALGMAALAVSDTVPPVFFGASLVGLGFAIASPNFNDLALNGTAVHQRGRTAGIMTTSIFLGQILSPFATLPLLQSIGFPGTFAVLAGLLLIGSCTATVTHRLRPRQV